MSIAERREKLQAHINAWRNLQWTDCIHLLESDQNFAIHVASGGILVIRWRIEPKMTFVQLPSNTRGIPMRQWEHTFSFTAPECELDPCEDILVAFQSEE